MRWDRRIRHRRRRKPRSAMDSGYDPGALRSLSCKPLSRVEADLVLLHQIVERWPADPEQLCRFRQIGAGLGKSELEHLTLGAGSGGPDAKRLRLFSLRRKAEIGRRPQRGVNHYHSTFQTIF